MIDIKVSAEEKAAAKELREKTKAAYGLDVSIDVLGARVLVLPIMDDEDEKESLLLIDERTKQELKGNGLQRAIVKSIGTVTNVIAGDIVYVYPNQFEATIAFNGVGYLVYQERNIIAKDKEPVIPIQSSIYTA